MAEGDTYSEMIGRVGEEKFISRFEDLLKTAQEFIKSAGYNNTVYCNERILMQVLLDYYSDIERLKDFHDIEKTRTEKIFAYTISWIIRRKPLQFKENTSQEKDIFVNERFAAYLLLNECLCCGNERIDPQYSKNLEEYIDLLFYYFKYRQCNPQVIELMISSFKMGSLVLKKVDPPRTTSSDTTQEKK